MSTIDTGEIAVCPQCSRTLLVKNGVTMCPSEDFPTAEEMNPKGSMLVDGSIMRDPFAPSTRAKSAFDYAHDNHYNAKLREWYPEQFQGK